MSNICVKRGDKMKKIRIFLVILSLSLLLAGCGNFRLASSIDDLISPVSPSGDNAGVQNAVNEYCKSGFLIKMPSSGNYTTSFIFYDLNADGQNEAVAFYEPTDDRGTTSLAVLSKSQDEWNVVESIRGEGSDVKSVDFCDVNHDGTDEILVCWSVISSANSYRFCVYRHHASEEGNALELISDPISAGEFICVDMDEDGFDEVVVFQLGSTEESPTARLYSFADNRQRLLGETKLDSTIISFENITSGVTDEGVSVYADALKTDGNSMVTEFIYWSDYYDSIVSPFYSYSTGRTSDTARDSVIYSQDIDGDGVIEIPTDRQLDNLPSEITAHNWVIYDNTVLIHKCYTYSCKRDSYSLLMDDKIFSDVRVEYDSENRQMTVISNESKGECFRIVTVIKSAYDADKTAYAGYTEIFSDSGFVYLARVNENADIKFSVDDLKSMIKPY